MNKVKIKSFFYIALIVFLFPICISSCEFEMSDNGDLDGFWQMTEKQIIGEKAVDMRNTGTVIGVQFKLMNIRNSVGGKDLYCRFNNDGNTLRLYDFRIKNHDVSDLPVEEVSMLYEYGIFSLDEKFKIETLTNDRMELSSEHSILKFRKY